MIRANDTPDAPRGGQLAVDVIQVHGLRAAAWRARTRATRSPGSGSWRGIGSEFSAQSRTAPQPFTAPAEGDEVTNVYTISAVVIAVFLALGFLGKLVTP
jgi:hypothetical protein